MHGRRIFSIVVCLLPVLLLTASKGVAQVTLISPLGNGIAQVHDSVAHIRVRISLGPNTRALKVAVLPDTEMILPFKYKRITDRRLYDSLYIIPRRSMGYSVYWEADSMGVDLRGSVSGVVPGHVFGIAGQSNAAGWAWEMTQPAIGDIRMLHYHPYWETASEPTGPAGGGPWIVMANRIWQSLDDSLPIGLINTALGATGLMTDQGYGSWKRNDTDPEDQSTVYGKALRGFRSAGSELEQMCWIQGETEGCCYPAVTAAGYRSAFGALIKNLTTDLGSPVHALTLQISGQHVQNWHQSLFAIVREAQRSLPNATLVGTGVGRALRDEVHYMVPALYAIGKMYADAYLTLSKDSALTMFPPLNPDTVVTLDSVSDPNILGGHCITVHWRRGQIPVVLRAVTHSQYFALESQNQAYDTSDVAFRISPYDPSAVQIWLRSGVVDPSLRWWVTYIPTPGAQDAPLATVIGRDTIFATAFYQLPATPGPTDTVPFQSMITNRIHISGERLYFLPFPGETVGELRVYNAAGQLVAEHEFTSSGAGDLIDITGHDLFAGVYFVQLLAGSRSLVAHVMVP